MSDISKVVYRPVAFPKKFLGAPQLPAVTGLLANFLIMIVFFIDKNHALWGLLGMFLIPIVHGFIMYLGFKEPHLESLMKTYHLTVIAPRTIEGRGKSRRIFHAG
jgi:hypothetical protein